MEYSPKILEAKVKEVLRRLLLDGLRPHEHSATGHYGLPWLRHWRRRELAGGRCCSVPLVWRSGLVRHGCQLKLPRKGAPPHGAQPPSTQARAEPCGRQLTKAPHNRPQLRGYVRLVVAGAAPWSAAPSPIGSFLAPTTTPPPLRAPRPAPPPPTLLLPCACRPRSSPARRHPASATPPTNEPTAARAVRFCRTAPRPHQADPGLPTPGYAFLAPLPSFARARSLQRRRGGASAERAVFGSRRGGERGKGWGGGAAALSGCNGRRADCPGRSWMTR